MSPLTRILLGLSTVVLLAWWKPWRRRLQGKLPPGPRGDPIIGHIRYVPGHRPEVTYKNWGNEYNTDILYLNFIGEPFIVLNSLSAAVELLEKRGAKYAGRPSMPYFAETGFADGHLGFYDSGPQFRKHRRLFQNAFIPSQCKKYQGIQLRETRRVITSFLNTPEKWEEHIALSTTAILVAIVYGKTLVENDPYIQLSQKLAISMSNGGSCGATTIDIFPWIRKLPHWFTLISSLKFARECKTYNQAIRDIPFAECKKDIENGCAKPSFMLKMLQDRSEEPRSVKSYETDVTEFDVWGAAGTMYAAGQDTSYGTLMVFILAMILYPDTQAKAWKELDTVIGRDRLPTFEDRDSLPHIENIVLEVLRWNPTVPLGVPHKASSDDTYNGIFIPKATIVANAYAMSRDESVYTDPESFNPDRYIATSDGGAGEPSPVGPFGFGRRICPGQHLAIANAWIMIVRMLATVSFSKSVDEHGVEVTPVVSMSTGLTSHPAHFDCVIRPRYEGVAALIAKDE